MPKPAVLPVLAWREIFASGRTFAEWIEEGESAENRQAMQAMIGRQIIEPQQESLLAKPARPIHVVVITKDWCGDIPAARRRVSEIYAADPAKEAAVWELLELIQIAASEGP